MGTTLNPTDEFVDAIKQAVEDSIVLSSDQLDALHKFETWLNTPKAKRKRQWFSLHGSAGTGKTFLAHRIMQIHWGNTLFCAYSGKAAALLRDKNLPAKTLHSLIYLPVNERIAEAEALDLELQGTTLQSTPKRIREIHARLEILRQPSFILKPNKFPQNTLIVCDEMSMVSEEEGLDLLSFGFPVLVLGDPFQLAPIKGRGYFNNDPDVVLTQIHRQALDSPIIKLATMAREGRRPPLGIYGDSRVVSQRSITDQQLCRVDQVITGSNKGRLALTQRMRAYRGFTGQFPCKGEKVICGRNNPMEGVLNGDIFEVASDTVEYEGNYIWLGLKDGPRLKTHKLCFTSPLTLKTMDYSRRKFANEFDFAAAITTHRFQGSESKTIIAWSDMWNWSSAKSDWARWAYTSLTRASESVTLAL